MALIHHAQLEPSKLDVLASWVPAQPWGADGLQTLGAYRFDDPDGQVGIETHVLRAADGRLLQVPVTYRDIALAGADENLLATAEHSVLGRRWIYDATADPVYVRALAATLLTGTPQARLQYAVDGGVEVQDPSVRVRTVGETTQDVPRIVTATTTSNPTSTVIQAGSLRMTVLRVLGGSDAPTTPGPVLVGTWDGAPDDVELVRLG